MTAAVSQKELPQSSTGRFDVGSAAGVRQIPLSDAAVKLLVEWRVRVKRTEPESLMFSTWSGKPISPNNVVRRWIVPACETLGLKRVSWLTLRRTYSSWAHEKGVPGKVIAQLMGHAKVDTTLNVYTQVVDGSLRRAADTVGSELFTIVHKPQVTNLGHRRRRPPERSEGKRYRAKNVRGQGTSAERFWLGALDDFRNLLRLGLRARERE